MNSHSFPISPILALAQSRWQEGSFFWDYAILVMVVTGVLWLRKSRRVPSPGYSVGVLIILGIVMAGVVLRGC